MSSTWRATRSSRPAAPWPSTPVALLRHAARHDPGRLLVLVLSGAGGAAASLAVPSALGAALDAAVIHAPARHGGQVPTAVWWLVVAILGSAACTLVDTLVGAAYEASSTIRVRRVLIERVLGAGVPARRRPAAGDLATRVVGDAVEVGGAALIVIDAGVSLAVSLGGLVLLWRVDWRCAAALLAVAPAVVGLTRWLLRTMSQLYVDYDAVQARISSRLTDALEGARTIRAAGTQEREVNRVLAPLPELAANGRAQWAIQRQAAWHAGILLPVTTIAVLATAGFAVADGRITPGEFVTAGLYATLALGLLDQIGLGVTLGELHAAARRLTTVLGLPVPGHGSVRDVTAGDLTFCSVSVRGDQGAVLSGVDLHVPAGTALAVVGSSGSGKSTLAHLAGRLLDPDDGRVLLGGRPLPDLDPGALRRAIGYAFERPELFGATVADGIRGGCTAASLQEVRQAARLACADAFVSRLPQGYATPLAGLPLSGGERQRLGLARAFLQAGGVLILDDATSSLDTATEAEVTAALAADGARRTRLIVAHRAMTAARADLVAWLDAGRLRAVGTHRQLWTDPAYRALFAAHPDGPASRVPA